MSESDDTDLLLLIPPDFFVIQSDSEDSIEGSRRNNSEHIRFKELISQVNELEERVNFIESKDNINPHNFSDANRVNRSVDYSLSFDSSNYHNVVGRDLALRFYSLTSADFRLGSSSSNVAVQCVEPCIASSTNKLIHCPHQTSSPLTDPTYESTLNYLNSSVPKQTTSVDSSNYPVSSSNILDMNYAPAQSNIKCVPGEELHLPSRKFVPSQPYDISFLNEIDEFLENKNKQIGKHIVHSGSCELENLQNLSTNKSRGIDTNEATDINLQSFSKMQSSDVPLSDRKHFDLAQVDRVAHTENTHSETKLNLFCSDPNYNPVSCIVEPDHPVGMEEYRQDCENHQNVKERNSKKKNADVDYFLHMQDLDTQKFNRNCLHNPPYSKFSLTGNTCTLPKQSSLLAHSFLENENKIKRYTSYGESESSSYVDLNENEEKHGCERQAVPMHSENSTVKSPSKTPYHRLNTDSSNESRMKYPSDKNTNPLLCASEFDVSKKFISHGDKGTVSKDEDVARNSGRHCPNSDLGSNLEVSRDRVSYHQNSKFRSDVNSSLCTPFNSESNTESSITRKHHSMQREFGQNGSQLLASKDSNNLLKEGGDAQSEISISNPYKSIGLVNEHVNQTEEKKLMSHRLADGINKAARPTFIDDGYYSSTGGGSSAANLLSLSELWGGETKELQRKEIRTVDQHLEEEHYRRKHCENVIQQLQFTVLEHQQKLAVAMRVDQSKDHTIQQLQTAWRRLANHWQELEEQRHNISVQYSEVKEKHQQDMAKIMQKVNWCEVELSKALDLAQGHKEKSEMIEHKMLEQEYSYAEEKKTLEISIQEGQKQLLLAREELGSVRCEIAEMKEKLEAAEKNAYDEKESAVKAHEEVKNVRTLLENFEVDFTVTKEENESLRLRLKEERSKNDVVDQQLKNLKIALDESRKKEKFLQEELIEKTNILEKTKIDLRDYYQRQVELVVQEKLVEFQTQLDAAELSLHKEIEQKENLALESASKQIKHITEKNLLEVKLLEEKHREELHLSKLQLTHATQQIQKLQAQLQTYSNRKVEIVEKLHTVMETQWQEALRIISGSSPIIHPFQEHALPGKDTSYNIPDRDVKTSNNVNCTVPPLPVPHSSGSSSTTDEIPFNKEDQLTFRANSETERTEGVTTQTDSEDIVKKYIEMLLNRPPGNPLEQESSCEKNDIVETPVSEGRVLPKWEKVMENHRILQSSGKSNFSFCSTEDSKCMHLYPKDNKSSKPPWK